MFREIFLVVSVFLLVNHSTGYKWLSVRPGDLMPANAISLKAFKPNHNYDYYDPPQNDYDKYVGRARHHNEVLLAEVNSTSAVVRSCGKGILKYRYEVLVGENCKWANIDGTKEIPMDIVRGGTRADGEPIFVGKYAFPNTDFVDIQPISLEELDFLRVSKKYILRCDDNNEWVDTTAGSIPNNTISGGKSENGNDIFVAKLKTSCTTVPGQVDPALGLAMATYKNEDIRSAFCQVLVGDIDQYKWISTHGGDIPDYAVVGGMDRNGQLMYVSRINKTVGYIKHSTAAETRTAYEILVKKS